MDPSDEDQIQWSSVSTVTSSHPRLRLMSIAGVPDGTEVPFVDEPPTNIVCSQCRTLGPSLWRFPCSHGFCDICYQRLMPAEISKTICPIDQQSVSRMTVFQDSAIQEIASPLRALCPHDCGETVRLCTLSGHFQFCNKFQEKLSTKRCFLRGLGCHFESNLPEELEAHENSLKGHKEMIASKIDDLVHLDSFRNQVNEALGALMDANRNQTELKDRIALLEGRIEEMSLNARSEQNRSTSLPNVNDPTTAQPSFQFQLGPMSITTYGSEHHLPSLGVTTTSRGAQELVCPDGQFQWKLTQYSRAKFKERHSPKKYTSSPSFYAGNPGYHFKLRLHLNGIGSSGRGKYLGVGIVLLKGQFDAQLQYPIHNPITVTLIDQSEKSPENVEFHLGDPSFVKPKGDYTVPYVWHEFIELTELEGARFLVNDSIIFRVKVAPLTTPQQHVTTSGKESFYPSLS